MRWSRWMEPIRDRMVEIRWEAVKLQATDLVGLKAKATILHETVDNNPDDIRSQLTLSLCEDLISFPDTATLGNTGQKLAEKSPNQGEAPTAT